MRTRTTSKLPPALKMERTKKGFSTMPLKRYPHGLCTALAKMIHRGAEEPFLYYPPMMMGSTTLPSTSAWRMTPLTKEKMVMISLVE